MDKDVTTFQEKTIRVCFETITVPLRMIFEEPLRKENFPKTLIKAKIVSVHENGDTKLLNSYCLGYIAISLKFF